MISNHVSDWLKYANTMKYEHIHIFGIDFLKVTFYHHCNVRILLHIRSTLKQTNLEKVCLTPTPKDDRLTIFNQIYS